jgi:UDP-glucose 4-epimerase
MTTIAVTGAAGYLGARLCVSLAARGDARVIGIDLVDPRRPAPKVRYFRFDVGDASLPDLLRAEGVRAVAHFASIFEPLRDRRAAFRAGVASTRGLLAAAPLAELDHLLIASSTMAYGAHPDNPPLLREEDPLRGNRAFAPAADLVEVERFAADFAGRNPDTRVAVIRPCVVLGPRATHYLARMLQQPVLPLPADADPAWQFIHEDDLAEACRIILDGRREGIWNLAGEGTIRLSECAARLGIRLSRWPSWAIGPLWRMAWRLGVPFSEAPPTMLPFFRWPWIADGSRAARDLGFAADHGATEAFESFLKTFA